MTTAASLVGRRGGAGSSDRVLNCNSDEGRHFASRRVRATTNYTPVNEYQGEAELAAIGEYLLDGWGVRKSCGVLRQVESLNRYAAAP